MSGTGSRTRPRPRPRPRQLPGGSRLADTAASATAAATLSPSPTDALGLLTLTACAAWALFCATGRQDARPEGVLLVLLAVTAGYALGRVTGSLRASAAPAALAVAVAVCAAFAPQALTLDPAAPADPADTPTAVAALLALATAAACIAALRCAELTPRRLLFLLGLLTAAESFALTGVRPGSLGAAATCLVCASTARTRRRFPTLALLTLGGVLCAAAALYSARTGSALHLLAAHPLRGIGPGLLSGPDRGSTLLQTAAEQGVPGLLLLACAFVWSQYALLHAPTPTPAALTASAALTALAAQSALAPTLGIPAVTTAAGFLLGTVTARPDPAQLRSPD